MSLKVQPRQGEMFRKWMHCCAIATWPSWTHSVDDTKVLPMHRVIILCTILCLACLPANSSLRRLPSPSSTWVQCSIQHSLKASEPFGSASHSTTCCSKCAFLKRTYMHGVWPELSFNCLSRYAVMDTCPYNMCNDIDYMWSSLQCSAPGYCHGYSLLYTCATTTSEQLNKSLWDLEILPMVVVPWIELSKRWVCTQHVCAYLV